MDLICSSRGGLKTFLGYCQSTQCGVGLQGSFGGGGEAAPCMLLQEQKIKDPQNFALEPLEV